MSENKVIKMDEVLNRAFDEIEQEVQEKFPNKAIISLDELMQLPSVYNWYVKLLSYGCAYNIIDNKTGEMNELKNGTIYMEVASSSEIQFICDDISEPHYLCREDAAKLGKGILSTIINRFCIRIPHRPISIPVKYKERHMHITYETRETAYNFTSEHFKRDGDTESQSSYEYKLNELNKFKEKINMLMRYGIEIKVNCSADLKDIAGMSKAELGKHLSVSVPSSSRYKLKGKEISGDFAIHLASEVLREAMGVNTSDLKNVWVRDEHWGNEQYDEVEKLIEEIEGVLFERITKRDK